jgi:outer membrane protein
MKFKASLCLGILSIIAHNSYANDPITEADWGIAGYFRSASIPFSSEYGDESVQSFVPMLYYHGDYAFIDGLEGGLHLYADQGIDHQLNLLIRARFIDIPRAAQNEAGGDTADFGLQYTHAIDQQSYLDYELMSDSSGHFHANLRLGHDLKWDDWAINTALTARYKSADFNSTYYSLTDYSAETIGAGVDLNASADIKYHVASNLYLLGKAGVTYLDSNAYHATVVKDRWQGEAYIGIGFFNDDSSPSSTRNELDTTPYIRIAHGWATPSDMGEILTFNTEKDPYNNQLSSVFYGYPVSNSLLGLDIDSYITSGLVHHWTSSVQSQSTEYVVAVKAYYTFEWPTRWRMGVAEGLSYIDRPTYIESSEMEEKGYTSSNLLNYIDISLDVNLGELSGMNGLNHLWLGYSLHHRSAIFESSSLFGRIKGGSNYNTIYLQYDF